MNRRHQAPQQIVRKLRKADRLLSEGVPLVDPHEDLHLTDAMHEPSP